MTIAFVHASTAILPEIAAYRQYFTNLGYQTRECSLAELSKNPADIEWHFMGIHTRRTNPSALLIHEYASRSAGRFGRLKDQLKKWINIRPDFRLFLNEYTRAGLNFTDQLPWGIRTTIYFPVDQPSGNPEKIYDFVYAGTTEASRQPEKWLSWFAPGGKLEGRSLLVLGPLRKQLVKKFPYQWIHFQDTVPPTAVDSYLQQARFGLNFQPDTAPFNQQPSAKLLAYAAAKLPVISTDYAWVREFQRNYGGTYFFLNGEKAPTWEALTSFSYHFPDLSKWTLDYQLKNSGILAFLEKYKRQSASV
ncbi:hypothetical protein [Flavihumibacter sp. CACIAM 22H1]|uniref:hypothetical protein n=1 Tax=Flavihumibacter sp. CACIAM 22H1 TaxID=1812911 RepID=UPI0007A84C0C|nr:hypothetical protein [Flavihumibacter sp. CACIAM 22H1]KYP16056.1 MAG: hypothetical protein A1D16_18475 [Flavihumibacter sp. CACIAM 22H1]